jgi:cell fate regulator YaaT (PSP1 superfamily)
MRFLGEFRSAEPDGHRRGQEVIVRTDRGTELGEVLCPATDRSAVFLENPIRGEILRGVDATDLDPRMALAERQAEGVKVCGELIAKRRLQMQLIDVEAILGGERMVFYYLAEKRVDFRELVKDLARAFGRSG